MIVLKDQMGNEVRLTEIPQRIVSLVPSQTELLYDLGLGDRVVGITKFCVHPDSWYREKKRVGGTKSLNLETIFSLNPDLILGNKEENSESDILQLQGRFPVYMSDIFDVPDALQMIQDVGLLTETQESSKAMIQKMQTDFQNFPVFHGSVLYLIWADPYMAVGHRTFIGDMIRRMGMTNVLKNSEMRYVSLTDQQISTLNPDFIFLSTEPFPFKEEHENHLKKLVPSKLITVDGEMFSWYGSRMLRMKDYFTQLEQLLKGN